MEFGNTKFDVRDWTEEQKVQFQEKCFELGYGWLHTGKGKYEKGFDFLYINKNGDITLMMSDFNYFKSTSHTEKTWEDMFPTPTLDVSKEIATLVFEALDKMEEEVIQGEDGNGFDNLKFVAPVTDKILNWEVKNLSDLQIQFMLNNLRVSDECSVKEVRECKYLYRSEELGLGKSDLFLHGEDFIASFNDTFKEV